MHEQVRAGYDRVAQRYADEIGGELAGKPLDRALLACLVELLATVAETTGPGLVGDLGCGPGHVTAHLAKLGVPALGIDLSPVMVEVGRERYPQLPFRVGSLLALPIDDGELLGAIALYSIIHLEPADRAGAYRELARVIRPSGWLLVAFHVTGPPGGAAMGELMHTEEFLGEPVSLDLYFLDPAEVAGGLRQAGFEVMARTDRRPWPGAEYESQRCYLLCRRESS
jgi:SAM-dependent methyltransferase